MKYAFAPALCALALAACSGSTVKDTLGINRSAPDEFRVVSRPPLSVPPQFDLRPPGTPGESPLMPPADKTAKNLMIGNTATDKNGKTMALLPSDGKAVSAPAAKLEPSSPESQFLRDAGAGKANPNIRAELEADKATAIIPPEEEDTSWWDIFHNGAPKKDPVVDAKKEQQRIKQNQASGQPVTTGDTPNVKTKDTGWLGSIFGY